MCEMRITSVSAEQSMNAHGISGLSGMGVEVEAEVGVGVGEEVGGGIWLEAGSDISIQFIYRASWWLFLFGYRSRIAINCPVIGRITL